MTKYLWPITTLGLVLLMGVALLMAPFGLHFHPTGGAWNRATEAAFWSGVGLVVVALAGIYGWMNGLGQEAGALAAAASEPVAEEAPRERPAAAPTPVPEDPDLALQQLARAVLRDLNQKLGENGPHAAGGGD